MAVYNQGEEPYSPKLGVSDLVDKGFVYFVRAGCNGLIKIGWATDVRRRVKNMQAHSSSGLRLLAQFPGSGRDERELHQRFKGAHRHGEWFKATEELMDLIESVQRGRDGYPGPGQEDGTLDWGARLDAAHNLEMRRKKYRRTRKRRLSAFPVTGRVEL